MEICVRPVRADDAESVVCILNPIIQAGTYTALDSPLTVEYERDYISSFSPKGIFHIAERWPDRRVIGLQSIEPFATYTRAFEHVGVMGTYIDLSERRHGVGKQLSQVTFQVAKEQGLEKLLTYVRADNLASVAFHLRLGFRVVGTAEKQVKLNGEYLDEFIIEKWL